MGEGPGDRSGYRTYPVEDHESLASALDVNKDDRVLDVGGGHASVGFADVVVDIDFESGQHRDGRKIRLDHEKHRYVQADVHHLPFSDKCFDVVICIQVLEHVSEPAAACEELMRVAHRGFLEVPRKWTELYAGYPSHRWLIDEKDGALFFEPNCFNDYPFFNFALPPVWNSPELMENAMVKYRCIPCIQLHWTDRFEYVVFSERVLQPIGNAELAGKHYHFARNLLYWMAAPEHGLFHASRAVELMPSELMYRRLLAVYLVIHGRWKQALKKNIGLKRAVYGGAILVMIHASRWLRNGYRRLLSSLLGLG